MHVTNDLSARLRAAAELTAQDVNDRLRRAVTALAEVQGRTGTELCDAMRGDDGPMSRSALHTRRIGQRKFHAYEVAQLAALFGVTADALLAGDVATWQEGNRVRWRCGDVEGSRDLDSVLTSMAINGLQLPTPRTADDDTDAAS